MSLYTELKRRNVIRVVIAYVVASWLLIEVAGVVFPAFGIPESGVRLLIIACAIGFLPAVWVSWAYELTPEGIVRDAPVARSSVKRLDVITVCLVVIALLFLVANRIWFNNKPAVSPASVASEGVEIQVPAPAAPSYPANSIAVLPFINLSDDTANEYFSDGVSEELLNLLSSVQDLRVISRSSAFSFKGKEFDIPTVAEQLNVAYVLEGSVRKAGDRVRVTVQLIDTHSDLHIWSGTYDRMLDDIFAIQDEIAGAVVGSLKLTLLGGAPQTEKINPEAYTLYLQARYLNAQGTEQAFEDSIGLYKEALAIAPDYARAWRGLAVVYMNQGNKGFRAKNESYTLAREAIDQALAINPEFAMAHATRGVLHMTHDGDLAQAAPHFEYALSLEPNNLVLLSYSSSLLLRLGRLKETIAIRKYDVAQDPLDPIGHNNLSFAYLKAEQPDDALAAIQTLLMLAPDYSGAMYGMGSALLLKGEDEAALEAMQKEPSEVWRLIGQARAYGALGKTAEADGVLTELIERYEQGWAYYIASLLACCGETDRAFDWLRKAVQQKSTSLTYVAIDPSFKNIHDDSRWLPFLESIGMSPSQLAAIEFEVTLPD